MIDGIVTSIRLLHIANTHFVAAYTITWYILDGFLGKQSTFTL